MTLATPYSTLCVCVCVCVDMPSCIHGYSVPLCSNSEALKQYFEQFGTVKEVDLKYNRDTNKSRSDFSHLLAQYQRVGRLSM